MQLVPVLSSLPGVLPVTVVLRRPLLVGVEVSASVDLLDPAVLAQPVCELSVIENPALVGRLARFGLRRRRDGRFSGKLSRPLDELLGGFPARSLFGADGLPLAGGATGQSGWTRLQVSAAASGWVSVSLSAPKLAKIVDSQRLSVVELLAILDRHPDLPLVDVSARPALNRLFVLASRSALLLPAGKDPQTCRVRFPHHDWQDRPVLEAVATLAHPQPGVPLHVDDDVIDVAEMLLASPAGREGLTVAQDAFVAMHLASRHGSVLALPPGSGKTRAAATVLAAGTRPGELSIVCTPVALISQWQEEIARSASTLAVLDKLSLRQPVARSSTPAVAVLSLDEAVSLVPELRARGELIGELIVDEAACLLTRSKRAMALVGLLPLARRRLLISGTPQEARASDAARLLSLARQQRYTEGSHPLVFSHSDDELPGFEVEPIDLALPHGCAALAAGAVEAAHATYEASSNAVVRAATLTRLRHTLASLPSKSEWVVAEVSDLRYGPAVVLSDFTDALEQVVRQARGAGLRAEVLDGRLSRVQRAALLAGFAAGEFDLVAVAPSAQRGVDLPSAGHVVMLDLPLSAAQLLQRASRARRLSSTFTSVVVSLPASCTFERAQRDALAGVLTGQGPEAMVLDEAWVLDVLRSSAC